MDERRSTLPSIMPVAQPVPAERLVAGPAVDVAAQVEVAAVPEPPVLELLAVQFLRFPVAHKPVRARSLLPAVNLRPELKVVNRVRLARVAEAAVAEVVPAAVRLVAEAVVVVKVVVEVAAPPLVVRAAEALRFRARRSSTCCLRPAWM